MKGINDGYMAAAAPTSEKFCLKNKDSCGRMYFVENVREGKVYG